MNELDLLATKKGMTFGKAWMLIFFTFISLFFVGMAAGFISAANKIDPKSMSIYTLTGISFGISSTIAIVWGYFINLREWPFFKKQNVEVVVLCLFSGFLIRFLSSGFEEIPLFLIQEEAIRQVSGKPVINFLTLLGVLTLQIGIIAHGLFRNYPFQKVVVTVLVLSVVQLEPRTIISLVAVALLLMIVYYLTASFHLVMAIIFIYAGIEFVFSVIYGFDPASNNNYRHVLIHNDPLYYALMFLSTALLVWSLFRIKKIAKGITWRRDENYHNFEW